MSKSKISFFIEEIENNETITITISKGSNLDSSSTKTINKKLDKIIKDMATNTERLTAALSRIEATYAGIQSDYAALLEAIRKADVPAEIVERAESLAAKFEAADAQFPAASTGGEETPAEEGEGEFGEEETTPVTE